MRVFVLFLLIVGMTSCAQTGSSVSESTETTPAAADTPSEATPSATASGETYTETIPGTEVAFTMAKIPGGTFLLGSPDTEAGREDDEGPQRSVALEAFWIGVYEVTFDEYALLRYREQDSDETAVGDGVFSADAVARPSPPYEDPAHGMGSDGHPAVGMTQWGALQYARWLSEKTGRLYRLPTEAEWEYACRAGSATAYGFGEDAAALDDYAWHSGNSDEVHHPVGQKAPNAWGLFDMHGNVGEWTMDQYVADFYSTLEGDPAQDPWSAPTRLHPRTVRGGSYDDDPAALRCADRVRSTLEWKRRDPQLPRSFWWNTDSPFVGFRLVSPDKPMTIEEIRAFWAAALDE